VEPIVLPQEEQYFKGQLIDASVLGQPRTHYPWLDILKSIPVGSAREVVMGQNTVRLALDTLVKRGKIKKDEFYMVTRANEDGKKKRRVFIVHRGKKTA
jgi:hypothetical protein